MTFSVSDMVWIVIGVLVGAICGPLAVFGDWRQAAIIFCLFVMAITGRVWIARR